MIPFEVVLSFIAGILYLVIYIFLTKKDENIIVKKNDIGKYELRIGYRFLLNIFLQCIGVLIFGLSSIASGLEGSEMVMLFLPLTVFLILGMAYSIMEWLNHRIYFDEVEILRVNPFKKENKIRLDDLDFVGYDLLKQMVLKSENGNKMKISSKFTGVKFLKTFLEEKGIGVS